MTNSTQHDIQGEFQGARFRDTRLKQRLIELGTGMAKTPERSFPNALSKAELEACYRFCNNAKVEPELILEPHVKQTLDRIAGQDLVLVAHDSSTISVTSEGNREGLTPTRGTKQSFLMHCSLALSADGTRRPEGVLAASYHIPTDAKNGSLQERWLDHVITVHGLGLGPANVIHLMDREADDYELLALFDRIGGRFVIRVQHDRRLEDGRLREVVGATEVFAEREIELSQRSGKRGPKQHKTHPNRKRRLAKVCFSAAQVTLPGKRKADKKLTLNVVHVWEPEPPLGEPPVEWLLYTSEPIDTAEQILQVVDWYRARWTIEEYFKALKTGCAVEKRQFSDFKALTNSTALFLPIAWKLLRLKTEAAVRPHAPATTILDEDELEVLVVTARKPLPKHPTVSEVMTAIADLGGHLKHNGAPGWQVLGRGYDKLRWLVEGWKLRCYFEAGQKLTH